MTDKPVLFFIHGYAVGNWYFDQFKAFFEQQGYTCYAPTLPLHDVPPNKKEAAVAKLGLKDYIDHLEKEILKVDTTPVLIGHSLGGLLVQHLANRGLARDLVLLQPAAPRDISMVTLSQVHHHFGPIVNALVRQPFKYSYAAARHLFFNNMSAQAGLDLYNKTVYESGKVMFELLTHQQPAIDPNNIKGKVLAIAGSEDRGCTPKIVKKIALKYGDKSTYKEFSKRGHEIVIEEGWEEVAEYISQWLNSNIIGSTQQDSHVQAS